MTKNIQKISLVLLVLGCTVVVNLIAGMLPEVRWDISAEQNHSLGPATKNILKNLDDVVNVKFFVSANLPPAAYPLKTKLEMTLSQYAKLSGQKVRVDILDPTTDSEAKTSAEKSGIYPLQFSDIAKDQVQVVNGYFGLVVGYHTKEEALVDATNLTNIEYFLTSAIKKVSREKDPAVTLVGGHGELEPNQMQLLHKVLTQLYQVDTLDWTQIDSVASESSVLVFLGGEQWSQSDSQKLAQLAQSGRGILMVNNQVSVGPNLMGQKKTWGLESWLESVGITIKPGVVADPASVIANFQTNTGNYLAYYPYWLQILTDGNNGTLPMVANLAGETIYWAAPLQLDDRAEWVLRSSKNSWLTDNLDFTQTGTKPPETATAEAYTVAGITKHPLRIGYVSSDPQIASDSQISNNPQTLQFILNLVDYLAQDEELVSIRNKTQTPRPLTPLEPNSIIIVKVANLLGPVVVTILFWITVNALRKKWHATFSAKV